MTETIVYTPVASDEIPPLDDDIGPAFYGPAPGPVAHDPQSDTCKVCGKALTYSGRGRHPEYCDEHRTNRSRASMGPRIAKNDQARMAAKALANLNGMAAMGLMVVGLPDTAGALAEANDSFEEQAYAALQTDPKLCALILKGGATSGKLALIIAYAMLAGQVVPTAIVEGKEKRDAKALEKGDDE